MAKKKKNPVPHMEGKEHLRVRFEPVTSPLTRFTFEMTEELKKVLTQLAKDREESRNATVENLLWQMGVVRKTAKAMKIKQPERRGCGRPELKKVEKK